jgi:PAS domain S-box-containing protein
MSGSSFAVSKGDTRRYLFVALCVSVVLITVGTFVLVGWSFDIALLKSVLPGLAAMKPNTAICFILSGVALWQAARPENVDAKRQRLAQACALVSTLIGAVTLSEYLWSLNIGIDGLLFRKALLATNRPFPGRMAHVTALEFAIFGIALLLLNSNSRRGKWLSQRLALLGTAISLIALVGYAYGAEALYRVSAFSSVALHTALLFTLLGFAILCARPDQGIMRTLTSTNLGGLMARKILPLALTLPFLLGWIRLQGQYCGLYGTEFGLSIFTIANVLIFAALIWIGSSSLNKVDAERQRTTEAIQESEERFRTMADSVPQLAWIAKADGFIYWYNQRWYEYTGTTREQMEGWGWQSVHDPLVLPNVLEQWGASIATGKPFEMEFPLRRADGVYRSFLTRCLPLKNAEGQVVQWFGTNTDVTKLKRAEDEIRQLNADLERRVIERTAQFQSANVELSAEIAERKRGEEEIRKLNTTLERRVTEITTTLAELATSEQESRKNRDFFESIIENIPNMVFLKEARELRFFRMNKAGQSLLGYSPEDLLGKNDYDFFPKEEADFFTNAD